MVLDWSKKTYVMGILNVTPDSFSGDGLANKPVQLALKKVKDFISQGVDIIDIGGESTRPGSSPVSAEEELQRVLPVIKAIREEFDILLSIDTYKARVAEAALKAGVNWVNDVWGLRMDPDMVKVVAEYDVPVIIMHNRSKPKNVAMEQQLGSRYVGIEYDNLIEDVKNELLESVNLALSKGVRSKHIILDPGIGFGKTVEQNLQLIKHLKEFKSLGYPLLVGPSRKSFIGYTLNLPPEERVEGTAAAVAVSIVNGANIVRVHDVLQMVRVARMTDAILKS